VHERLRQVAQQLRGGQLPLGSFVITKQLTKRPEDYPDARAQPHVQVRWRQGTSLGGALCVVAAGWATPPAAHSNTVFPRCMALLVLLIIINPCKPYLSASATAPHPLGRRKAD
jgi:hypothetical protein